MTAAFLLWCRMIINDPAIRAFIPDGTFMLAYRGSIAHNMYVPNSDPKSIDDVDLMGVVIGEESDYFGLHEWGTRGTKEVKQGKYDCVFYEIRKMFSLLLQGNPNVLSLLWLRPQDYLLQTAAGKAMTENRHLFAGKHVYNAFAGYAHQQLTKMEARDPAELRNYLALTYEAKSRGIHPNEKGHKMDFPEGYDRDSGEAKNAAAHRDEVLLSHLQSYMKKGENLGYLGDKRKGLILEHGYDSKNAAHCVRLLRMASEYLKTGELTVFRQDADELLDIKRGRWDLARVKAHADDLFAEMRSSRDSSKLPDEPDRTGAEKLLAKILREHFASHTRTDLPLALTALEALRDALIPVAGMSARIATLERALAEAQFRPIGDNHHNANAYPYCLDAARKDPAK